MVTVLRNVVDILSQQTARPPSPTCSSSVSNTFNFNHLSRPRKPRDSKPKMKKLKYHQYIPPDQRGGSGTSGTNIQIHIFYVWSEMDLINPINFFLIIKRSLILKKCFTSSGRSQTEEHCPFPVFRSCLFPALEAAADLPPAADPPESAAAATAAAASATVAATAHCRVQVCQRIAGIQIEPISSLLYQWDIGCQIVLMSRYLCSSFSRDHSDPVKSSGVMPLNPQPVAATANQTSVETNSASKPELLPANLVDLTVRKSAILPEQ